ncbi:MAG: hypothetical protein HFJ27_02550 [Clostridia bacterium]|nr:hypothetical protein [Clostridia bacterium]
MKNNRMVKVISSATLISMLLYTLPVMAYTKEETVYSKLDQTGTPYQTIVSSHIKNTQGNETIQDISDLLNIENTNGYETFEKDGNTVVWNADGKDIYYQGESKKNLPISCNISYELDGKKVSQSEIVGKSGKVKITLEYTNNEKHVVNINGKNETMYTPFLVIAGTIINNENNKNITISNGKMIDDGTKTIVIGMAFPGINESLGIEKKDFDFPSKIEIEMDTTDFELDTIASFVTPKIIEEKQDLEKLDKLEEVYQKVATLQSASEEILQGAKKLKEGTEEYSSKKKEFNVAMQQVSQGMSSANTSYQELDAGISSLNKNSKTLGNGAKQISEGTSQISQNLDIVADKLGEVEEGSKKLELGEQQIAGGLSQISKSISASINPEESKKTIQNLQTLIAKDKEVIDTLTKTNEDLSKKLSLVDATTKTILETQIKTNRQMIELLTLNKKAQEETLNTLQTTSKSMENLQKGISDLQKGVNDLHTGTKELTQGITNLKEGTNTLASKLKELEVGAKNLYQGTLTLSNGTKKLSQGSRQIKQGLNTLDRSTGMLTQADNQLTQVADTIQDGANTLYEGIFKFNEEGIKPICNVLGGRVKDITKRIKKLGELSLEYNNYTMLQEGQEGRVQFILLADGIQKESTQKQEGKEAIINDNRLEESKQTEKEE